MNINAIVLPNAIPVSHAVCGDREFISFPISGWDEVKKYTKKVLLFEDRQFTFSCWNSDRMDCHFVRLLNQAPKIARIL
jgi:hypothetical protein